MLLKYLSAERPTGINNCYVTIILRLLKICLFLPFVVGLVQDYGKSFTNVKELP